MTIGQFIENRRKSLGLTLESVGQYVGVSKSTVLRWERGDIQRMKASHISALARVLQIDPVLLFQDEELLMPEEKQVIDAYRKADTGIRTSVRILLGIHDEKKDSARSAI